MKSFRQRLAQIGIIGAIAVAGIITNQASFKAGEVYSKTFNPTYVFPEDNTPYSREDLNEYAAEYANNIVAEECGRKAYTPEELDVMALTIWGEARGEGILGMRAVAHVIQNRANSSMRRKQFGGDVIEVALKNDGSFHQFSAWNEFDPNAAKMSDIKRLDRNSHDYAMWLLARQVAKEVLSGESVDITDGRRFYHTADITPYWSKYGTGRRQIGKHIFYYTADKADGHQSQ